MPPRADDKDAMINITWRPVYAVTLLAQSVTVPWLMVLEDLGSATSYLKLRTTGTWTALAGLSECGPDGLAGQSFPDDRLIVSDCSVGALIGRIGGSSATLKAQTPAADSGEGKPFPLGCYTVLKLPDKFVGPLFIGFNILLRPIRLDRLDIDIEGGVTQ